MSRFENVRGTLEERKAIRMEQEKQDKAATKANNAVEKCFNVLAEIPYESIVKGSLSDLIIESLAKGMISSDDILALIPGTVIVPAIEEIKPVETKKDIIVEVSDKPAKEEVKDVAKTTEKKASKKESNTKTKKVETIDFKRDMSLENSIYGGFGTLVDTAKAISGECSVDKTPTIYTKRVSQFFGNTDPCKTVNTEAGDKVTYYNIEGDFEGKPFNELRYVLQAADGRVSSGKQPVYVNHAMPTLPQSETGHNASVVQSIIDGDTAILKAAGVFNFDPNKDNGAVSVVTPYCNETCHVYDNMYMIGKRDGSFEGSFNGVHFKYEFRGLYDGVESPVQFQSATSLISNYAPFGSPDNFGGGKEKDKSRMINRLEKLDLFASYEDGRNALIELLDGHYNELMDAHEEMEDNKKVTSTIVSASNKSDIKPSIFGDAEVKVEDNCGDIMM